MIDREACGQFSMYLYCDCEKLAGCLGHSMLCVLKSKKKKNAFLNPRQKKT